MKKIFIIPFFVATCLVHAQPLNALDALKIAASHRPALLSAKLNVEQARSSSRAFGAYSPTLFGLGASSRSELGSNDQDLLLSQPIDLFGKRSANKTFGEAGVQIALAEYRATASGLQNEVLTAFAQAVGTTRQREIAEELLKLTQALHASTRRRFEEGKVAELQLIRATIELDRAQQSTELRRSDLEAALKRLAGLLGMGSSDLSVESDATIAPLINPVVDSRADLLLLKAESQRAEAEAGIARASRRPDISLQLVRSPWSKEPGYFAGRLQLTWALFDHGKARNESQAASQRAEAARKLFEDALGRAKTELEAAQIDLGARQNRIKSYESILVSARDLVRRSQQGYSEGFGTQIDVLEATRALREVEQELVDARQQLALAVIAQYRASGFLAEVLK